MTARPSNQVNMEDAHARPIPRLALREREVADSLGIGLTTFHDLVKEGKMPGPVYIRPRLPLYDFESVRKAWESLRDAAGDAEVNPFDE